MFGFGLGGSGDTEGGPSTLTCLVLPRPFGVEGGWQPCVCSISFHGHGELACEIDTPLDSIGG